MSPPISRDLLKVGTPRVVPTFRDWTKKWGEPLRNAEEDEAQSLRVLLVDGSRLQLSMLRRYLQAQELEIQDCTDGRLALKLVKTFRPNLLITGLLLPSMNGDELVRRIRGDAGCPQTSIIVITASDSTEARLNVLESGADDFINKGCSRRELLARVHAHLRLHRSLQVLEARSVQLQEQMVRSQRLELQCRMAQRLEAVGQLAAGIAHEINTPAQYISDNTSFLAQAFVGLVDTIEAHKKFVESLADVSAYKDQVAELATLREEADVEYSLEEGPVALARTAEGVTKIAEVTRALKNFAKPDQTEMVESNLADCANASLVMGKTRHHSLKGVPLLEEASLSVLCHTGEINQVILALLSHAARSTEGAPSDFAPKISLSLRAENEGVTLEVASNGCSPSQLQIARMFDPDSNLNPSNQGLAVAYAIVTERHQGRLTYSRVGRTCTFRLWLPENPHHARERREGDH